MNDNDNKLAAALMARIELHFARQTEIVKSTIARMERSLEQTLELQAGCAAIAQSLDRIEAKNAPPQDQM